MYRLRDLTNKQIDNSVIISNEGDTLSIDENYFYSFYLESLKNKYRLIQGIIDYPDFIKGNHNLVLDYITIKEKIHLGLGLNYENIPAFGGIMPIGRNFSIHPRIALQIASIDSKYIKGTDDDINMGLDITYLLGSNYKIFRKIPLVTNPRREVILMTEYLQGKWENGKKMYECFHEVKYIYDYSINDIMCMNENIDSKFNLSNFDTIIHELFIWVFRNIAKSELISEAFIKNTIIKHSEHLINYWQMENDVMAYIISYIDQNPSMKSKIIENSIFYFHLFTNITINRNLFSIDNHSYKLEQH